MLNWLVRYAPVSELLLDGEGRLGESLLDVGSGSHGFACTGSEEPFVGLDLDFPEPVAASMLAVKGRPGHFPFADASFDTVISLDTLEHVPPAERRPFVAELARVAARRVVVACPSDEAAHFDDIVRESFARAGIEAPAWLNEHDEHGLPSPAEIAAVCEVGPEFAAQPLPMPNGLLSLLAVAADMYPELAALGAGEFRTQRDGWLDLFGHARFGDSPRKAYLLERLRPLPALVERDRLAETAVLALRCLGCGGSLGPEGRALLRCAGCGAVAVRGRDGVWDVAATGESRPVFGAVPFSPPAEPGPAPAGASPAGASTPTAPAATLGRALKTDAALRLWLAPSWSAVEEWLPPLATYVALADPDGDTCLCLAVDERELPLDLVVGLIGHACAQVTGGGPFAEVLVVDEPVDPTAEGAVPVVGAADVRALLGLPVVAPATAPGVVAHARRSKALADELRAAVDRALYLTAPDPAAEPQPLVTVRIATWGGPELLLARAIPSALGGSYGNLEVLVCSDGPDERARRAVEGIGDPRVRYTELPARPSYPAQPWNFWQSAGTHAVNHMLDLARGAYIAPLDHDDAFTHDHVEKLLAAARERGADLVYGQALCERRNGPWEHVGSEPLAHGQITHGSVLYSRRLAHFRLDPEAWLLDEPGDWNMWRRMRDAGARVAHLDRVVFLHFRERSSIEEDPAVDPLHAMERGDAELAADVLATGARWLLDVAWRP